MAGDQTPSRGKDAPVLKLLAHKLPFYTHSHLLHDEMDLENPMLSMLCCASEMQQSKVSEIVHNSARYLDLKECSIEVHFWEILDLVSHL